jgi:hypothetical protein
MYMSNRTYFIRDYEMEEEVYYAKPYPLFVISINSVQSNVGK